MLGVRGQSAIATLVERQTRYVVTGRRPRQDESPCVRAHREEDQNAAAASRGVPHVGPRQGNGWGRTEAMTVDDRIQRVRPLLDFSWIDLSRFFAAVTHVTSARHGA